MTAAKNADWWRSRRASDAKRRNEKPGRAFYDKAIWRGANGLRRQQLDREPRCERHLKQDPPIIIIADTVNHRIPHQGNWALFIDPANHESTCKECHDSLIKAEEARGHVSGNDLDGRPLDPAHPWNRKRE